MIVQPLSTDSTRSDTGHAMGADLNAHVTPTWVKGMSPCRWYAISGDHPELKLQPTAPGTRYLADNDPARDPELNPAGTTKEQLRRLVGRVPLSPWHGALGFSSITEAWNGGVYASRYGASGSMIIFGGGHNDYFGSDVHAFDLASRHWRRIADGYVRGGDNEYGAGARYPDSVYPDGSPLPPHTYDYAQYDPLGNDYVLFKGQTELGPDVQAVAIPHLFNLDTLRWRQGSRHPTAILNSGGWTTWDETRRVVWGHSGDDGGGNAFIGFSPDGANADGTFGHWGERFPSKLPGVANHNAMQIDPVNDVIIVSVHAHNELYAIDPADPGREIVRVKSVGCKPVLRPFAALEYAPNLARLVYFSPLDRGIVYTISAPSGRGARDKFRERSWEATKPEALTLEPIGDAATRSRYQVNLPHAFGRFRVASFGAIDLAILVRHVDSPVYAMRLN
jgi:hypothetical protein